MASGTVAPHRTTSDLTHRSSQRRLWPVDLLTYSPATGPTARRCRRSIEKLRPHLAVVVAVPLVLVMQVPLDQVVRMVAMGYRLVPAAGPMLMRAIVRRALMPVRTSVGIRACNGDLFVALLCPHNPHPPGARNEASRVPLVRARSCLLLRSRPFIRHDQLFGALKRPSVAMGADKSVELKRRAIPRH